MPFMSATALAAEVYREAMQKGTALLKFLDSS